MYAITPVGSCVQIMIHFGVGFYVGDSVLLF